MIKLFDVTPYKTDIKGFWIDNGKIYIDNIRVINIKTDIRFKIEKRFLFKERQQLAVFYIKENKAYIEDNKGNITILKNRITWKEKYISKAYLKALLLQHKGLTIYKNDNDYTIEIWRK